jgi:DNA-directed RNA polymerase sigma subunit (sigma70/sigma32)
MPDPEYGEALVAVTEEGLEPQNHLSAKAHLAAGSIRERDAESVFSADLARTVVLTREQEFELGRKIVRARRRVRALLRRAPKLTRAALADGGRGVMAPEDDFREREAVLILEHARRALRGRRSTTTTGLGRRDLRAFVAALATALEDYRELRDEMVCANVRLVGLLARRYRHPTQRNVKFSTYASWWIWQQLGRAADTQGGLIRTPVHWGQLRRRVSREEQEFASENDGPPTRDNLASLEGIDRARLEAMSQSFHFVSIDASVSDEDERPLESTLCPSRTSTSSSRPCARSWSRPSVNCLRAKA